MILLSSQAIFMPTPSVFLKVLQNIFGTEDISDMSLPKMSKSITLATAMFVCSHKLPLCKGSLQTGHTFLTREGTKPKCYRAGLAQTYLQPHYGNGVFGNVYLSGGQH